MLKKKVIIIGAGIGGLSAAIRLAKKNYQVIVYESSDHVGGKTKKIEIDGFSWGYGASLLTMPYLIDELFTLCGKNPNQYYNYHKLDPICQYFFSDQTELKTFQDKEKLLNEFQDKLNEPREHIEEYMSNINNVFKYTETIFLQSSLHKLKTYFRLSTIKSLFNLSKIGLTTTMNLKNSKLFKNSKTVQLFNRYATYNGSNPYRTPATMNVIAAPEYTNGAYIMENGMPHVSKVLYQLAIEEGVEFNFNQKVQEIYIENKKAKGVILDNQLIPSDIVISNVDIHHTYHQLLPNCKKPANILNQERSTSALIFYWGISNTFEKLETHNIFFSDNYQKEFDAIEKGSIYEDATVYIFISSKKIKNHAPLNMENWFVLINVPHDTGQNWEAEIAKCKQIIFRKLMKNLKVDISKFIVCEYVNTPKSIEKDTFSFAGSLYGPSSNNKMSAFLRHPNFSNEIKNVYFTGGSVHPGGGVPLCILSGKIVSDLIN